MKPVKRAYWRTGLLAGVALLTLVLGQWSVQRRVDAAGRELQATLLHQANGLSRAIDPQLVRALAWNGSDRDKPEYRRLCEQLAAYREVVGCRGVYTLALRDGKLRFGPESYAPDDPQASPPGTVYQQPGPDFSEIFQSRRAFVCDLYTDEYGTFIGSAAPVVDPQGGEMLMAVGLDMEVGDWQATLRRETAMSWLAVLALALAALAVGSVLMKLAERSIRRYGRFGYTEICLIAALGFVLTAALALYRQDREAGERQELFEHLAHVQATRVTDAFRDIYSRQLGTIAQFFLCSESVTRQEFGGFVRPLITGSLQALGWVAAVPAAEKETWEAQARADGLTGYTIWQSDPDSGQPAIPVRETCYPVWYAEPKAGNEKTLGWDLGSESFRREALEQARQTGLATATRPIALMQDAGSQQGLLVFHPVYADPAGRTGLKGFALAVMRLETLLRTLLADNTGHDDFTLLDMYHIRTGQAHLYVGSGSTPVDPRHRFDPGGLLHGGSHSGQLCALFPLFLPGQSCALAIHPGPAFLRAHPVRAGWLTALTGTLLTLLLTGFAALQIRRRQNLEILVKASAAELGRSEERFRQLAELFPETIFETGLNGRITYLNGAGMRRFGFDDNDLAGGIHFIHTVFPEDRNLIAVRLQERLENHTAGYSEYRAITKAGSVFPARGYSGPMLRDGQPAGLHGFVFDIGERKQAEETIVRQRTLLEAIINAMPAPLFYKDRDGVYLGCNQAFADSLGLERGQIAGKTVFDVAPAEMAERYCQADRELVASGRNQTYESEMVYADGTRHQVVFHKALFREPDGPVTGIVGTLLDITERKRMEEALRDREARFHALTTAARDAIIMIDPLGKVTFWNPAAETMLGYRRAEAIGSNMHRLIAPPRYRSQYQKAMESFRQHGTGAALGKSLELTAQPKTGPEITVALSLSMVELEGQYHAVGILRDISEQKKAERDLLSLNESLQAASLHALRMAEEAETTAQNNRDFLASVSHEIRAILAGMTGAVDLLLAGALDAGQRRQAEEIRSGGAALLGWLDGMEALSVIETNKSEQNPDASDSPAFQPFDPEILLHNLGDNQSVLCNVVNLFLADTHRQIDAMKALVQAGDAGGTRMHAHSIKGASAAIGAPALSQTAATLERQCRTGELDGAAALLLVLEQQFDILKQTVQTHYRLNADPPDGTAL